MIMSVMVIYDYQLTIDFHKAVDSALKIVERYLKLKRYYISTAKQ